MKPSFEEDFQITHLEFYSLVVRVSENEHDIHPIQSKKVFTWLTIYDSYLEVTKNGSSDSNKLVCGRSSCLMFSFVKKLSHVVYQNLNKDDFRSAGFTSDR